MKKITALAVFFGFAFGMIADAQVSFTLSSSPTVGTAPQGVVAADLTGNGIMDLVAANAGGNTLSVLFNDGSGNFSLSSSPGVGNGPTAVTAVDVNGDGAKDLICVNYWDSSLTVVTNDGGGNFVTSGTYPIGAYPEWVTAADVNGDDTMDLITANSGSASLTVLTNNGSGSFATANTYNVGGAPESVVAADVNGDGKPDLICVSSSTALLTVLTNNGIGGFVVAGTYTVGSGAQSVVAADVNGDGYVDLICANYQDSTVSVLTNDSTGKFATAGTYSVGANPGSVVAVDLDGDGWVDIATANDEGASVTVLTNDETGTFVFATTIAVGNRPQAVVAADVNGDGEMDLIAGARFDNAVSILLNNTPPIGPVSKPLITTQPVSLTSAVGAQASFSVRASAASGPKLFNYQWRFDGTNLPAATNNVLNLPNVALSQAGIYDVVVADSAGSVTSSPAVLNVFAASVSINGQVTNGTVSEVASARVSITSGFPFIFYTLDGSTPGLGSTFYTGPFTVSNSVVVQAMALSSDFSQSGFSPAVTVQILDPLNVTTPGGGSILANGYPISPATNYASGTPITLTATPSNGWSFISWQGSTNSSSNPLNISFNQSNSLQAIFGTVVATNILGSGTVAFSQPNPVPFGTALKVSAVPNTGSYLVTWSSAASSTNTPTTVMVTNANPVVGALFTTLPNGKYSLSVVINGSGSVTNNPQQSYYNSGSSVVLTATNSAGVPFLGWSRDVVATNNTITVMMTNSKVIVASFGVVPTVVIATPGKLVSGQYQLTFPTVVGFTYTVQYSADLKTWSTLTNYPGSGNPIIVMDPAGSPRRFYRISTTSP